MLGPASRAVLRSPAPRRLLRQPARRLISFAPPAQKSRSWKSSALRWGIAIGGIYYYNTSSVFKDEDEEPITFSASYLRTNGTESDLLPTLDNLAASRRQRLTIPSTPPPSSTSMDTTAPASTSTSTPIPTSASAPTPTASLDPNSSAALEEEAEGEGAFNPETGEINWDCPCLGGMAHGPCGPAFRDAFSCFVYSDKEPKGVECIDRFRAMQDCFREHPDVYGAELADDDDDDDYDEEFADEQDELKSRDPAGPAVAAAAPESHAAPTSVAAAPAASKPAEPKTQAQVQVQVQKAPPAARESAPPAAPVSVEKREGSLPSAWNDARSANDKTSEE